MARTLNETIRLCTDSFLAKINPNDPPEPAEIEAELVTIVKDACLLENATRGKVACTEDFVCSANCNDHAQALSHCSY